MPKVNIISEIKNKRLPVIICGASLVGKILLSVCKNEGIAVECFCDANERKTRSRFCGLEVIFTPNLKTRYKDAVILVTPIAIKDAVGLLQELGFYNWYAGGLLLKDVDITQKQGGGEIDYTKYLIESCILCHDSYLNPASFFVSNIDLIITERCSLRCKDCSNLMQYYENPKDCDMDTLLKSIGVFCELADDIMEFRVIGGDVFMNKEWPIVIRRLVEESKVRRVLLYTNGTIIPLGIEYLRDNKVLVMITDYGALSKRVDKLRLVLGGNGVAYHVAVPEEWGDCSGISVHNRSIWESKAIFNTCCGKNLPTLSEGKLFRCPYSANANRLGAVSDYKSDYVDILEKSPEMRDKVRGYLFNKDFLVTCDYCNGRPLSGSGVKPAVQIDKPLRYHKYG